jgi:hypothetical protein
MLRGEYLGLKCEIEQPRLLFIDTEQHPRNTQLVYRRICRIAGIDGHSRHSQIKVLHMRGAQVEEIRHALLQEIVLFKPDVVYLDGLVDCVVDPNDQAESKAYITELSGIALRHDCSIWSVLHVNPGTEKMRGHLGTIMAQKVSDVLQCLKEKQPDGTVIFTVEQTDTRNKDINKFSFAIEDRKGEDGEFLALPVATYINVKERAEVDEFGVHKVGYQIALFHGYAQLDDFVRKARYRLFYGRGNGGKRSKTCVFVFYVVNYARKRADKPRNGFRGVLVR